MQYLLGSTTQKKQKAIKQIASKEGSFYDFDLHNYKAIPFEVNGALQEGEIFSIKLNALSDENAISSTDLSNHLISELEHFYNSTLSEFQIGTAGFTSFKDSDIQNLGYVAEAQKDKVLFQACYKSTVVYNKLISLKHMELLSGGFLVISETPEVIYDRKLETIYFFDFRKAKKIFPTIGLKYRPAKDDEISSFFDMVYVRRGDGFTLDKVGDLNRKRIAAELDTLEGMSSSEAEDIFKEITEYYIEEKILIQDGFFIVQKNQHIDMLMSSISERLYTTKRSKQKRIAVGIRNAGIKS